MTRQQIELVTKSWDIISKINMETVGGLFYIRLFEIAPDVIPMFKSWTIAEQSKKLLSMLSYIVSKLNNLEEVMADVIHMAERHINYGVKDEHYSAVSTSLLWTLEKGMGSYWNKELQDAWAEVYNTLATTMIAVGKIEISEATGIH